MTYLKHILKPQKFNGYTLVEVVVSLAIIGLFTLTLTLSGSSNIKTERFSGSVNEFANTLRQTQVASYTIQTAECLVPQSCFWRGNVIDFTVGADEYKASLLSGNDISSFSISGDQRLGITAKHLKETFNLSERGLTLSEITLNGQAVGSLSLAFLAPDGKAAASSPIVNGFNPNASAYPNESVITFTLVAEETSLVGTVTYDPKSGKLDVEIR